MRSWFTNLVKTATFFPLLTMRLKPENSSMDVLLKGKSWIVMRKALSYGITMTLLSTTIGEPIDKFLLCAHGQDLVYA